MKYLIFLLSLSSIVYTQEISSFRDKKEVFCGINRDISFKTHIFLVLMLDIVEESKR